MTIIIFVKYDKVGMLRNLILKNKALWFCVLYYV